MSRFVWLSCDAGEHIDATEIHYRAGSEDAPINLMKGIPYLKEGGDAYMN